jgi:hypothetical protein
MRTSLALSVVLGFAATSACQDESSMPQRHRQSILDEEDFNPPKDADDGEFISLLGDNGRGVRGRTRGAVRARSNAGDRKKCDVGGGETLHIYAQRKRADGDRYMAQLDRPCGNVPGVLDVEIKASDVEIITDQGVAVDGQPVTTDGADAVPTPTTPPATTTTDAATGCTSVTFRYVNDETKESSSQLGRGGGLLASGAFGADRGGPTMIPGRMFRQEGSGFGARKGAKWQFVVQGSAHAFVFLYQKIEDETPTLGRLRDRNNRQQASDESPSILGPESVTTADHAAGDGSFVFGLEETVKPNSWFNEQMKLVVKGADATGAELSTECETEIRLASPIVLTFAAATATATAAPELVALGESQVHFDVDGDGRREQTGWIGPRDAFLAVDLDGDGAITSGRELFGDGTLAATGTPYANGYAALAAFDSTGDGFVDAADKDFAKLKLWFDRDGDGRTDAGELAPLAAHAVTRLDTRATAVPSTGETSGLVNVVKLRSTFWGPSQCAEGCLTTDVYFGTLLSRVVSSAR